MDQRKQVQVLPKPDYKAEAAFQRFMQTVLDPETKIYLREPKHINRDRG
jgi:hypothetical protein